MPQFGYFCHLCGMLWFPLPRSGRIYLAPCLASGTFFGSKPSWLLGRIFAVVQPELSSVRVVGICVSVGGRYVRWVATMANRLKFSSVGSAGLNNFCYIPLKICVMANRNWMQRLNSCDAICAFCSDLRCRCWLQHYECCYYRQVMRSVPMPLFGYFCYLRGMLWFAFPLALGIFFRSMPSWLLGQVFPVGTFFRSRLSCLLAPLCYSRRRKHRDKRRHRFNFLLFSTPGCVSFACANV